MKYMPPLPYILNNYLSVISVYYAYEMKSIWSKINESRNKIIIHKQVLILDGDERKHRFTISILHFCGKFVLILS